MEEQDFDVNQVNKKFNKIMMPFKRIIKKKSQNLRKIVTTDQSVHLNVSRGCNCW